MARTKIGSLFADVTLNTKGLDKGIRTAQRKLRLFGRDATQTGKQLMLGIGTPMGIIGGQAVNVFQNFEQEMAKVKAISGATASEFKALGANARELGATTRFTATNVAELQLVFSKLGFTANEIEKVTGATLNLALATGEDLAESARVSAQTLRGFGLQASEMSRVVDVMGKSFSSSALDLNKFDTAMSVVSATARSAGISIEETTSLLAVLVDRGVDASSAGTALRNVFLEIAKQGLTLPQALDMIENSSNRNATAMQIFGKRGATVAQIIALNREEAFGLQAEFENSAGTAEDLATIMDDTLQGSLFKLKSAFEGVQLSLAQKLLPTIRGLVDKLSEFLQVNQDAIAEFLVTASKVAVVAMSFGAMLFVVGQLSFVLANIIGVIGFLIKGFALLVTPIILATVAMKAFGVSFAIAGFALFAKTIAIIVVVLGALKTVLEEIKGVDMSWGETLLEVFSVLATTLYLVIGALGQAVDKMDQFFKGVVSFFRYMDRQVKKRQINVHPMGFGGYGQPNMMLNLSEPLADEKMSEAITDPNSFKGIYEGHKASIEGIVKTVKQGLSGDFSGILDNLNIQLPELNKNFDEMQVDPSVSSELSEIERRTQELIEILENERSLNNITQLYNSFSQGMKSAMEDIKKDTIFTAEEVSGVMKDISNGLTDSLMEFFESGKLSVRNFVKDVLQQLARLQLQKAVVNPLLAGLESVFFPAKGSGQDATAGLKGRANGGSVLAGSSYLVGERGMEMFVPKTSGTIVPNDAMGGMGTTIVNFNVQATDANSFDQQIAQREQMLVGMIDKAFHKRGRVGING